jgi:hypothetical protein
MSVLAGTACSSSSADGGSSDASKADARPRDGSTAKDVSDDVSERDAPVAPSNDAPVEASPNDASSDVSSNDVSIDALDSPSCELGEAGACTNCGNGGQSCCRDGVCNPPLLCDGVGLGHCITTNK